MAPIGRRSFLTMACAILPVRALASSQSAASEIPVGGVVASGRDRFEKLRPIPSGSSTFKVSTQDTGGALFVMEHHNVRRGGPPRHLHHGEDELFYALEGDYIVELAGARHSLKTGDCVLGPRGIGHTWAFVGETPGRLLIAYAPAGKMEAFFEERDKRGGSYANDAALLRAFGMELLGPPLEID